MIGTIHHQIWTLTAPRKRVASRDHHPCCVWILMARRGGFSSRLREHTDSLWPRPPPSVSGFRQEKKRRRKKLAIIFLIIYDPRGRCALDVKASGPWRASTAPEPISERVSGDCTCTWGACAYLHAQNGRGRYVEQIFSPSPECPLSSGGVCRWPYKSFRSYA